MDSGAALRASAISAVRSIRYCSIGAMFGYLSDCAAAVDTTQPMAATIPRTIVSSDLRRISIPFLAGSLCVSASSSSLRQKRPRYRSVSFNAKTTRTQRRTALFRSREEKKLAHLAGNITSDGTLFGPGKCLVDISAFEYPKSAHVFLGLGVRAVSDRHLAIVLLS